MTPLSVVADNNNDERSTLNIANEFLSTLIKAILLVKVFKNWFILI